MAQSVGSFPGRLRAGRVLHEREGQLGNGASIEERIEQGEDAKKQNHIAIDVPVLSQTLHSTQLLLDWCCYFVKKNPETKSSLHPEVPQN